MKFRILFSIILLISILVACSDSTGNRVSYPFVEKVLNPVKAKSIAQQMRAETTVEIVSDMELTLWASDSLITDPIAISIDPQGGIYYNNGTRLEHSEFDIRGHRDWMTQSISWESVEDRRSFLRSTFDPSKSEENKDMLEDLNGDGSHDWRDLTVEKESVWRIEDSDGDGYADRTQLYIEDFHEEISDLANGIEYTDGEVFIAVGPDLWKTKDLDNDGVADIKESIAHGFAVHIGFGAHGMSGVKRGPDGRIYWGIGDIGMNLVDQKGKQWKYPNQGVIVRSELDGSNFEVFAAGLRNTHEFDFDKFGNLISEDNDGDHAGERERLVYLTFGSDSGWRANWQYGKYTDPKNNTYKVWMDEKMHIPHWDGQAAYITPPIINYVNGPTGFVYNPGTALSDAWKDFFFVAEFRGTAAMSPVHAFRLKPNGATFELDTTIQIVKGLLPTGLDFGPDGALYCADWIDGWGIKEKGRLWKLDVPGGSSSPKRIEAKKLIQADFTLKKEKELAALLDFEDYRIRQKAQFEIANRKNAEDVFLNTLDQASTQLGRIHALWGLGQLSRKDPGLADVIVNFLDDPDIEIQAQTAKLLGDIRYQGATAKLIEKLESQHPRIQFFAAEALGRARAREAVQPLIELLIENNDGDIWLRHGVTYALAGIGDSKTLVALQSSPSKAARLGAVVALRRMQHPDIAVFLRDTVEAIATEAARAINDDYSIEEALPHLANILNLTPFKNEALIRRSINANLRVGSTDNLEALSAYIENKQHDPILRAEALATLTTWDNPSVLDRVDGRFRGPIKRDNESMLNALASLLPELLVDNVPLVVQEAMNSIGYLVLSSEAQNVYRALQSFDQPEIMIAGIRCINKLESNYLDQALEFCLNSKYPEVRNAAIEVLPDSNIPKDKAADLFNQLLIKGTLREQQAALAGLRQLDSHQAIEIIQRQLQQIVDGKAANGIVLDVIEAAQAKESPDLQPLLDQIAEVQSDEPMANYQYTLEGGNPREGRRIFFRNEAAQCVRCHTVFEWGGTAGPSLQNVGNRLSKKELVESLIEPSARLAPGFGIVTLELDDGQSVSGFLEKESPDFLIIKQGTGEIEQISTKRIAKRTDIPSSMPSVKSILSVRQIRDLIAFLTELKDEVES